MCSLASGEEAEATNSPVRPVGMMRTASWIACRSLGPSLMRISPPLQATCMRGARRRRQRDYANTMRPASHKMRVQKLPAMFFCLPDPRHAFQQGFDCFCVLASEADIDGAAMEFYSLLRIVSAHQRQQQTQLGDVVALFSAITAGATTRIGPEVKNADCERGSEEVLASAVERRGPERWAPAS